MGRNEPISDRGSTSMTTKFISNFIIDESIGIKFSRYDNRFASVATPVGNCCWAAAIVMENLNGSKQGEVIGRAL